MKKHKIGYAAATVVVAATLLLSTTSCQSDPSQSFVASSATFPRKVAPFPQYLTEVRDWIAAERVFISANQTQELAMNMPFECASEVTDKGVLLVHGLGDSPYFFRDVAQSLCDKGLRVRTILLPGHGTKPGDMLNVSYEMWQQETEFHLNLLAKEVDTLYAGGFSTGANLVTLAAAKRDDIAGLMLFSPAFKSRFFVSELAPYVDGLFPWPNVEQEDNPSRYNSTAMAGFAAYQESVNALQDVFDDTILQMPVIMVVAEKDSVVDTQLVAQQFTDNFASPAKCLLWQGETVPIAQQNDSSSLTLQTMQLPAQNIAAASHMSVLFSPDNPLYGTQSTFRICDNGQSEQKEALCRAGEEVWYGPWGYTDEQHVYARLTYNPYFNDMITQLLALTDKAKASKLCARR